MGTKAEKGFQQEPGSSPSLLLAPTSSDPPASKGATGGLLSHLSEHSSSPTPTPTQKVCWGPPLTSVSPSPPLYST